jgi:hypothetical protein
MSLSIRKKILELSIYIFLCVVVICCCIYIFTHYDKKTYLLYKILSGFSLMVLFILFCSRVYHICVRLNHRSIGEEQSLI